MTNLDSILKRRDITLPIKVRLVKAMVFPVVSCMDVRVGLWRKLSPEELLLLNYGAGEDSWESLGLQGDPTSPSKRKSVMNIHWKDWFLSWNSNPLATCWEELTQWKRFWCWERSMQEKGSKEDEMVGRHHCFKWTWVWASFRSWWWTGQLECCSPWGHKESDITEWCNWTEGCKPEPLAIPFIHISILIVSLKINHK